MSNAPINETGVFAGVPQIFLLQDQPAIAAVFANPERLAQNGEPRSKREKTAKFIFYFSLSRRLRLFLQIPSAYPKNGEPRSKHEKIAKFILNIFSLS